MDEQKKCHGCLTGCLVMMIVYGSIGLFFGVVAATSMTSSPLKQRYGDKWCQTVVVKRSALDHRQLRPRWRFVLILLAAVLVNPMILFISEMVKLTG